MKAVVDENIANLDTTFARHLDLRLLPGRQISASDLKDAEVLLVRSVTRVDEALLAGSRVRFVGTATIGTDHLDTRYLDAAGIAWASAPGSNADAAAQYTLGMIFLACRRLQRDLLALRVGVIGHGNVGRRLHTLLDALGIACVVRDPPLATRGILPAVSRETVLACDVVCLHVPLTHDGAWPTVGMVDADALACMPAGALLVNSARGGVIVESALQAALDEGKVHAALDVWPQEPAIAPALLEATTVASPHVAGYSLEGKARGTRMIYDAFLAWQGDRPAPESGATVERRPAEHLDLRSAGDPVADAVITATRVARDDERMRRAAPLDSTTFDALRRAHAPRHEFQRIAVKAPEPARETLCGLGFMR
ncbi:MAG: 4-phosphoerythronate dehydrogenase [Xanthomonadales bacterium]|jgi:erythronate-4-phosphate dehydrogenase|nr:4-phosphoerythronate dehydrogenase [Xanthomonadales bacterium]